MTKDNVSKQGLLIQQRLKENNYINEKRKQDKRFIENLWVWVMGWGTRIVEGIIERFFYNVIAHVQFLKFPTDQERLPVQGWEKSGIIRMLTESLQSQHEDFSSLCVLCICMTNDPICWHYQLDMSLFFVAIQKHQSENYY